MSTTNPYPVDSTGITRGAGIPDADLDRLIAATIPATEVVAAPPDTDTATWRDYADRLTPKQIEEFESYEVKFPGETWPVVEARELAARNTVDRERFGHLPAPAGAVRVFTADHDIDGRWSRGFEGVNRTIGGVSVGMEGEQFEDGTVRRALLIYGDGVVLTAAQARELAAALLALAAELDGDPAGALRAALAAADPAALTRADRVAVLDLLRLTFHAAGIE